MILFIFDFYVTFDLFNLVINLLPSLLSVFLKILIAFFLKYGTVALVRWTLFCF